MMANRYDTNLGISLRPHENSLQIHCKIRASCSYAAVIASNRKMIA